MIMAGGKTSGQFLAISCCCIATTVIVTCGSSFITAGKGVYNLSKLVVSGTFGVLYEFYDECKYLIVPNTTNDSSLNPDEELTIIF